ncbi:RAD50-interacting protein 1 [Phymastichus coffea]|uniref:RAD50-interacting protein 1 n=1 Tax=Phymastichus coffea TaxID=108790 RepID=UPI00273BD528|nr:RAD50-interacting protein 1 [Phymastichus coffea]
MNVKVKVNKKFNEELGSSLNNLKAIEHLHMKLQYDKTKVEELLSLASSEAPSKIQEGVEEVDLIVHCIDEVKENCKITSMEIVERLSQENKISELQNVIDDISYLERSSLYLQFVKFIEDLSSELEVSLQSGNDEASISTYLILKETHQSLEPSSCINLKNYVKDTLEFWFKEIHNKIVGEYNDVLETLKWPFCGVNANAISTQTPESLARFQILTEYLFHLQLPNCLIKTLSSGISINFAPTCLPISLLVRPLKQRFFFHFTGNKKTNRRDKPEWFFTQILTWIKDHSEWVNKYVQPIAYTAGFNKTNGKVEFMRALVQLAVEKLNSELNVIQFDDSLFTHAIDESLGFERELRESLFYPLSEPATVIVLTQGPIFMKWLTMEKKYALENMDAILSSDTVWSKQFGFADDLKVTECASSFLILLSAISDRYNHLPQPGHRLQFLDLQLELIDDWRVRLLQLLHEDYKDPLSSLIPSILNTLYHVTTVLQDLGATVQYLQLYFYKTQFENAETVMHESIENFVMEENEGEITVFDEAISLLERLEKKLLSEIYDSIFSEIKAKSWIYSNEKWFAMQSEKEVASLSVTPSGCPMFQEIVNKLHALKNALALPLFERSWKNLAKQLDQHLFDELVLRNQFNNGGAAQLQFDITRNLLPLFGLYTDQPDSYFPLLTESYTLLNMLPGSAILLLEALGEEEEENITRVLTDVNIYRLTPRTVCKILNSRMDINPR